VKVLVIGSGPIVIGQAAEFDYAGTQACKALREEGHEVILINSNPATIMTDPGVSDALYIEPLTLDFFTRVIARERPEALLPTLGGQTGLNLATQLSDAGVLDKFDVKLLGTPLSAIRKAEDREQFRSLMREIKEPVPESWIIESPAQLQDVLDVVPYPCIIRPAYTLGGTGGGVAHSREELWEIGNKGLKLSMRCQIMVERSLLGWKEIEYEVMRDKVGNTITVCNMENLDPMGVHTGDSIVVAPSQTLSDIEYHMMRSASLKIINALGIEGGCNIQMALNPESFDYYIIEVNPRVSRSSALASKATGYPIARVAAKIAVGRTLDEIDNQVTGTTKACFEPALDYCVVKIPRWPFDKFASGDRSLFTQMKATGEVMAIDRSFEAALMKAIRGLEIKQKDLRHAKFQGGTLGPSVSIPSGPDGHEDWVRKRHGAYLPHWTARDAIYHVVYRLADSVPESVKNQWSEDRKRLNDARRLRTLSHKDVAEADRRRANAIDSFLDAGHGSCVLRQETAASIVRDNLLFFEGDRYLLHAWAIMPNHVHIVVQPTGDHDLPQILHGWKSYTSKAISKALGRKGELWQAESYDHIIRSESELADTVQYVLGNPVKAGLREWPWVGHRRAADETHGRAGHATSDAALADAIQKPTDERLWALAEALRRRWSIDEVNRLSRVDKWFLRKIQRLVDLEQRLISVKEDSAEIPAAVQEAFLEGYPSQTIQELLEVTETELSTARKLLRDDGEGSTAYAAVLAEKEDALRAFESLKSRPIVDQPPPESNPKLVAALAIERLKAKPVFKMVDTCAGEFESKTPYYYGTFDQEDDAVS